MPQPKILKPLDPQKIMSAIKNKIVREMKRTGLSVEDCEMWQDDDGNCHITIENNGGSALNASDYFDHPNAELLHSFWTDGWYEWATKHFYKDYNEVIFKLVR